MTDATLLAAVRHNCWANSQLIAFCEKLTPEQLEWTIPGTYGTVHQTLQHTIRAELGYLSALAGDPPPTALAPDTPAPLAEIAAHARSNAERIERALSEGFDPARRVKRPSGAVASLRVIAAQFIHHGSDHRAHVGSILGAHDVQPPDLDVWAYGVSIGEVQPPTR